jgi:diguanylate cyclase
MASRAERLPGTGAIAVARAEKKPRFWTVMKRCIQIAAFVDFMFFFIFQAVGSPILAWINIVGISMYAAAYVCLTHRKNMAAICLIWAEVLGHAALGTLMVGWDSGFHYYLLMFIPSIFVSTATSRAAAMIFVLWCFYVGLDAVTHAVAPLEPLGPQALTGLRYFNISVVFAMFAYLSSYYYRIMADAQKRLSKLAMTDPLTGLYNRRHILDVSEYEAVQRQRNSRPLSFIIADIDFFKRINDTQGHEAGDAVLVAVSDAVKNSVREQDSVSRWGGEEFLIVLPDTDLDRATLVANRVREHVAAREINIGSQTIYASLTRGVVSCDTNESVSDAIARADGALYKGKRAGRNRVESAALAAA